MLSLFFSTTFYSHPDFQFINHLVVVPISKSLRSYWHNQASHSSSLCSVKYSTPLRWANTCVRCTIKVQIFVREFLPKLNFIENWHTKCQGLIFHILGSAPAPPTELLFRVVLLHIEASGKRLFRCSEHNRFSSGFDWSTILE